jgi:hypothetical protein
MKIRGVEPKSESNEVQCWGENPNAQMLRVELRDGSVNLYPYAWLERVQFLPAEEADTMTLFFNRQSVRITGKKLRELVSALQRMAVEWVKEQSEHFDSIGTSGRSLGGKHSDCRKAVLIEDRCERVDLRITSRKHAFY